MSPRPGIRSRASARCSGFVDARPARTLRAVLFDAGNTLLFLDYARMARAVGAALGFPLTGPGLASHAPEAAAGHGGGVRQRYGARLHLSRGAVSVQRRAGRADARGARLPEPSCIASASLVLDPGADPRGAGPAPRGRDPARHRIQQRRTGRAGAHGGRPARLFRRGRRFGPRGRGEARPGDLPDGARRARRGPRGGAVRGRPVRGGRGGSARGGDRGGTAHPAEPGRASRAAPRDRSTSWSTTCCPESG